MRSLKAGHFGVGKRGVVPYESPGCFGSRGQGGLYIHFVYVIAV